MTSPVFSRLEQLAQNLSVQNASTAISVLSNENCVKSVVCSALTASSFALAAQNFCVKHIRLSNGAGAGGQPGW